MKNSYKKISLFSAAIVLSSSMVNLAVIQPFEVKAAESSIVHKDIVIDGNDVDEYNRFKGFGTVTCNNTSRLLLDYKEEHPDKYWEIMNKLFHPETGAGLAHIKVELGADVNSSSGTEPATKRYKDEPANVLRGAGFQFAADAKTINPNISTEILRWGEPRFSWTGSAQKDYAAKYAWYKETIDAVKEEYGFTIDYVGLSQNERAQNNGKNEQEWLVYFFETIAKEKNYKTDYQQIKYVAADGYRDTKTIASLMLENELVRENVDVISSHYGLSGSNELTALQNKLISEGKKPKEVWISEGIAPMINTRYRENMEPNYQGVGGTAGVVDVASRIISGYTWTGAGENPLNAISFDFQPAVAAFYEGAAYNPKHLISAYDPWSGFYEEDGGISGVRQIMNFVGQDDKSTEEDERWQYVKSASYSDGNFADGGVAVNTGDGNFLTLKDPKTNDYTTMYANNTNQTRTYKVSTKNLDEKEKSTLHLWETKGSSGGNYDENWLQHKDTITPSKDGDYEITVLPYSILTVTTLDKDIEKIEHQSSPVDLEEDKVLELPYTDDFEYSEYKEVDGKDYVDRRGGTPRYTTDQNGAFEVVKKATKAVDPTSFESRIDRIIPDAESHGNMLQQKMTTATIGAGWNVWGGTDGAEGDANPHTNLGDHRWTNYKASFDFLLDTESEQVAKRSNYALLGVRQVKAGGNDTQATYAMRVLASGKYEVLKLGSVILSGQIENFDATKWHNLEVKAKENVITGSLDGKEFVSYTDEDKTMMSGRISIGSGFYETLIDNLKIEQVDDLGYYADKIDSAQGKVYESEEKALAETTEQNPIGYLGDWNYAQSGYGHFNRTLMTAQTSNPVWSGVTVNHGDKGTQGELNKVSYSDGWSSNNSNAWAGTGKSMEITFKGTEVKLYGERNPSNGKGDIYLDGVKVDSVDFINNYSISGQVWETKELEDKEHTLKLVSTDGYISFIKAEITTTDKILSQKDIAAKVMTKVSDENLITDSENTVFAYRKNADWGSNDTNAWANFADNPYLLINFTGSGIDFKANTGSTAYKFELDGEEVGDFGPTSGVVYSIRDLKEEKHTLKVSLGENAQKDTFMDYRGVSIYHEPIEEISQALVFNFKGSGFNLFGNTSDAKLRVTIDGKIYDEARVYGKGDRQTSYTLTGLEDKAHTAKVEIVGGKFTLDGIDFLQGKSSPHIKPELDFTGLEALLKVAKEIELESYTNESVIILKAQIEIGEKLISDGNVTSQEEINTTIENLQKAIDGLVEKAVEADKTELVALISEVETLIESQYTAESWSKLQEELTEAKIIASDKEATQALVDETKLQLQEAKDSLEYQEIIEVESIKFNATGIKTLKMKKTFQIESSILPSEATNKTISYKSSNESIATIDENGLITGIKPGITKITGETSNGKIATVTLRVTN